MAARGQLTAQDGNSGRSLQLLPWIGKPEEDHRSMKHAQPVSKLSRGWMVGRAAVLAVTVVGVLAAPARSPAQDAGVSGIPPGPANARGLNGSLNDPSGIGNAARVPAIPPPATSPAISPTVSPSTSFRTSPVSRAERIKRTRSATVKSRRGTKETVRERDDTRDKAAVGERDKLLDRKILSICRGC
jgi:hypothetical protein